MRLFNSFCRPSLTLLLITMIGVLTADLANGEHAAKGASKQVGLGRDVAIELVYIPPGTFMMGSTPAEREWAVGPGGRGTMGKGDRRERFEGNPRRTRIKQGFWLGRTEVTVGQWRRFVAETGYISDAEKPGGETQVFNPQWKSAAKMPPYPWKSMSGKSWRDLNFPFAVQDNHPVVCVSWNDTRAFCRWLTKREREAGRLPKGLEYRLPTDAEWEYACRGGRTSTIFWWGNDLADGEGRLNINGNDLLPGRDKGWSRFEVPWSDGFAFISPVDHYGQKGRNGFGLADMLGNVWEICLDHWDPKGAHEDVCLDDTTRRVCRGVSFLAIPGSSRCAVRLGLRGPGYSDSRDGFRICLGVPREPEATPPDTASAAERPNFLVILTDDLGYGDLACYGNPVIETPNLDRLAAEGLRLTDCYAAAAVCSPARAGMMTGRTPWRVGVQHAIPISSPMHLRKQEITVATLLRGAGYSTCHVGKWHLNGKFNVPDQPQPGDHGFDHWFSTQNNALPNHQNPDNFVRNGQPVGRLEGYSAQLVAGEAIGWLSKHCAKEKAGRKPFFLYVCIHEPHEPIATDPKFAAMYPSPGEPSRAAHHGNVTQMDEAVGRLMRCLDELKLRDDTLVFFTSDNGPAITRIHPHGSAGPLRDKKGSMYEGGIRVPGILRWPGHTRPGSVSDEPVCGVDVLPTLCALAGVAVPADRAIDGASFLPILEGKPIERKTPLYWQYNYAISKPKVAMRDGDWKILAHLHANPPRLRPGSRQTAEEAKWFKTAKLTTFELYNLRRDIGETTDLAEREPERLAEMSARLRKLYREIQEESPVWPAWHWARYHERERIKWPDYWENRKRTKPSGGIRKKRAGSK